MRTRRPLGVWILATAIGVGPSAAQETKVLLDTDLGFASDDAMALLALLQSDEVELLGVSVVTGNDWLKQEVANTLRLLEIAGRSDVPVYPGAERPLVTSQEEMSRREELYGETSEGGYKGAWREGGPGPAEVAPPGGRFATRAPEEGHAVSFIIETIRSHPGEVVLVAIGPLTNVALAVAKDPEIPRLSRSLVIMGGGIATLPEFNFWMDPEAARMVLRAPWPEVTVTPLNISRQAPFTREVAERAARASGPIGEYFRGIQLTRDWDEVSPLMYDQIAVLSLLQPDLVTRTEEMWLDVEIDHGASYGTTLFWKDGRRPAPGAHRVAVQMELDYPSFVDAFIELMTRPMATSSP